MSVTREEFERFNATMRTLSDAAISDLEDMLGKVWRYAGNSRRDALDMLVKSYSPALAEKYGLSAASVSAALWEDIYHNDTGARLEALIPEHDDFEDSFGDAAVNIVAKKADDEDYEGALSFLTGITAKALYDWARKTQVSNTQRVVSKHKKGADQARFARIPTGDETCAFCLMLAGRGFVYLSELTAGGGPEHSTEFDRYHSFCDCLIVSSFDPTPMLEGYDPTVYERMYGESRAYDAKGRVDLSQTLSNMRRNYGLK